MENKKTIFKSSSISNNFEKPKLIKRDIKIAQSKKDNNILSVFNINKSTKKNSSKNVNNTNSNYKSSKIYNKSREIYSAGTRKSYSKSKKKQKKFKNIDEVVLLIQKYVRIYLYRLHNEPKLQMIKMIKQKKRNLFENYKIIDKPSLIAELKNEPKEKNINNINNINNNVLINENKENNILNKNIEKDNVENKKVIINEKEIDENNINENNLNNNINDKVNNNINNNVTNNINSSTNINVNSNTNINVNSNTNINANSNANNNENNNYIREEYAKMNEDLEGLNDKYDDIGSIDEEIINNYIEESKEINIDNNIIKPKKRNKKRANNFKFELVIDKKGRNKLEDENNNINNIDINDNNIDDNKQIENKSFNKINDKNENTININNDNSSKDGSIIQKPIEDNNNNNEENDKNKKVTKELIEKIDYGKINDIKDNISYSQNLELKKEKEINNNENINNYKDINHQKELENMPNNININEEEDEKNNFQKMDISQLNIKLIEAKKEISSMSEIIKELKKQLLSKDEYIKQNINNNNKNPNSINIKQKKLIDSLLSDKKQLQEKNQILQNKLDEIEKSNYKKLQSMRENYELEINKCKDAWFQTEKLRRKKWEEQKIKDIKKLTAKNLEPEIENIISNHKIELAKLEDEYLSKMKEFQEKIINENEQKYSELKYKLNKEKENAIENERKNYDDKIRKQNKIYEEEINEERKRWNNKLNNEIQRLELLREKDKKIYEEQINQLEERNKKSLFSNDNYYQKKFDEIKKEYNDKIKEDMEKNKNDLENKNNDILENKKNELEKKYQEMKKELLKDRDKQLNIIIQKLSEESLNERKKNYIECEKKSNEKNILLIEENNDLKKKFVELTNKLEAETKNRINMEQNIEILNKKLNQKNIDYDIQEKQMSNLKNNYNDINDKLYGLTNDFKKEKIHLELEMKSALQKGDAEIILLKNKLDNERKIYKEEKQEIINNHKMEIENLEKKIKLSFARKDEIIMKLQQENQTKQITIEKYEEMLNRKRKEIYGK